MPCRLRVAPEAQLSTPPPPASAKSEQRSPANQDVLHRLPSLQQTHRGCCGGRTQLSARLSVSLSALPIFLPSSQSSSLALLAGRAARVRFLWFRCPRRPFSKRPQLSARSRPPTPASQRPSQPPNCSTPDSLASTPPLSCCRRAGGERPGHRVSSVRSPCLLLLSLPLLSPLRQQHLLC